MSKKITITLVGVEETIENEKGGFAIPLLNIQTEGFEECVNSSKVVAIVLAAYRKLNKEFLADHICQDCPAYQFNRRVLATIDRVEDDIKSKYFKK